MLIARFLSGQWRILVLLLPGFLGACQSEVTAASSEDAHDAIFRTDAAVVRRHGRVMSWEKQQIDGYSAVLQEHPSDSLSCKERELNLVQPAINDLIAHADIDQRKAYDDTA